MLMGFSLVAMILGSAAATLFGIFTDLGWIGLVIVYGTSGAACLLVTALVPTMLREIHFNAKVSARLNRIKQTEN